MSDYYRGKILVSKDVISRLGVRSLVGATDEDLWAFAATQRPEPAGEQLRLISTSANDAPASTGVRAVRIEYLNNAGVKTIEIINLAGLVAVLTVAVNIYQILSITASTVGSNGGAVGLISVTNVANTVQFEGIIANGCQAMTAVYTVPAGKKFFVTAVQASSDISAIVRCKSNWNPETGIVTANAGFILFQFQAITTATQYKPMAELGPIPAGAKIWLTGKSAAATKIQATIEGYQAPA